MKKSKKKATVWLSRDECARLLACCPKTRIGARDRALISVLWRAQLRVSEALDLEPEDWDSKAGTLHIRCGKGGKARVAVLHESTAMDLSAWLAIRAHYPGNTIFCTLKGKRMTRQSVGRKLKIMKGWTRIKKRVHPHCLRHTGARQLAEGGVPMNLIQAQLGHASLATTSRYLEVLCPTDRIQAISKVRM